jgi:hypothetical protein
VSWYGFAREIFAQAPWIPAPELVPIRTADWPTPAVRPANSELDCTKIRAAYGIGQPDWRASLGAILAEQEAGLRAEYGLADQSGSGGPGSGGPGSGGPESEAGLVLPVGKTR